MHLSDMPQFVQSAQRELLRTCRLGDGCFRLLVATVGLLVAGGLHDDAFLLHAIDLDGEGTGETDVAHMLRLVDGGHLVEKFLTIDAVVHVVVDREIGDTEGGEVLKEMGALTGIDAIVLYAGFDDDLGSGDGGPLDGYAQPRVARTPSSGTDENVATTFVEEGAVDAFHLLGDGWVVGGRVDGGARLGVDSLDIYHVLEVGHDAVAYGVVGADDGL